MMQSCLQYSRVNDDLYAKVRGSHADFESNFVKGECHETAILLKV